MKKISKAFAEKVIAYGILDTRKYRYITGESACNGLVIDRIRIDYLDTTEALHSKSDYHPNGWETIWEMA